MFTLLTVSVPHLPMGQVSDGVTERGHSHVMGAPQEGLDVSGSVGAGALDPVELDTC